MSTAGPQPPWARWRAPSWASVVSVALVALALAIPLRALFRFQGPPMEEGFMLVFPERVLAGDIPNKDFLHLYGPGSLWALAGWFWAFGVSLASERLFGLLQISGIIFGIMALARPWGRRVATMCGLIAVLLCTTAIGLTALAWNGAVALGLISVWLGLRARRWLTVEVVDADHQVTVSQKVNRLLFAAGVVAGLALLFRPDVVVGITLASGAVLWGLNRGRITRWVMGGAAGVSPILIHLATAGPVNAINGMLLDPVFRLRGGRTLPMPAWDELTGALQRVAILRVPGWSLPALSESQQVFLWFWILPLAILLTVAAGALSLHRNPQRWPARVLLAVGLFSLGILPQALQRPDSTHLAWVSCVPIAFLPVTVAELWRQFAPRETMRHAGTAGALAGLLFLLAVIPYYTFRPYLDLANQSRGHQIFGTGVHHAGRVFYLGSESAARDAQLLVDDLGERAEPGERLFVGTADLRKTPYSDAYLYFLLPDLVPGTYFIEMDPGMANAEGSGLADDVASSDWLVLSHVWDAWDEPNDSREFMSDEANQVVRDQFCEVRTYPEGSFVLYQRCDAASPEDP